MGAALLLGSLQAWAEQPAPPLVTTRLPTVTVTDRVEEPQGRDSVRATTTTIGKGPQALRDVPQSITVVTERLVDDRNLDTLRETLHQTAGVTFMAAEGGEEDIRLRGFSLAATGDIFLDGTRDPAFYDRDTFNLDRIELLRGSASMLFGRGSTGGAVNQVSKPARAIDQHEVTTSVGSHRYARLTGDFNIAAGADAGLRINTMTTRADNNGAGSSIDKSGIALAYRRGIGHADELSASLYYLDNENGIHYGIPWIRPTATATTASNGLMPLDPSRYYGMASDYNAGIAKHATLGHVHRFQDGGELRTQLRVGRYERDQRAGTVRLTAGASLANLSAATVFTRGTNLKIQNMDTVHLQSDYSSQWRGGGWLHEVQAGVDAASEKKRVYGARTAAQGGVNLAKPTTTVGTPDDGAWIDESARVLRQTSGFDASALGLYAQDLVTVAPGWKVLAGLRYDDMLGRYQTDTIPNNAAGPATTTSFRQRIGAWSRRAGLLYQPDGLRSYHLSYGTSFNTSGDTYSYNAQTASTEPESSRNIEIGARLDSADKRFTTRLALFHSTKLNERNTDTDTAATRQLLSGRRHTAGFEVDFTGRLHPRWEIYGSYMWMPVARVDEAAPCPLVGQCLQGTVGNRVGDRPGLTPKHSGTIWTTYQVDASWRVGGGINFRSAQAPADTSAPSWSAPGFATIDLMAEYTLNDSVSIKANISNLANKLYADALYRGHYIPGPGRVWQLTVTTRF